jgi:hypothetical protein
MKIPLKSLTFISHWLTEVTIITSVGPPPVDESYDHNFYRLWSDDENCLSFIVFS